SGPPHAWEQCPVEMHRSDLHSASAMHPHPRPSHPPELLELVELVDPPAPLLELVDPSLAFVLLMPPLPLLELALDVSMPGAPRLEQPAPTAPPRSIAPNTNECHGAGGRRGRCFGSRLLVRGLRECVTRPGLS